MGGELLGGGLGFALCVCRLSLRVNYLALRLAATPAGACADPAGHRPPEGPRRPRTRASGTLASALRPGPPSPLRPGFNAPRHLRSVLGIAGASPPDQP